MTPSLWYLFFTFLKIGATAWGGFMALIAVIQKQMERDKVIDNETILDGISLASVLPGPIAVNVVSFVGYKLRGVRGSLVSMAGILLPSFLLMLLLARFYVRFGELPTFAHFFAGVLPAVAAIIVAVAFDMSKKNISGIRQILIAAVAAAIITLAKSYSATLLVMAAGGLAGWLIYRGKGSVNHSGLPPTQMPYRNVSISLAGVVGVLLLLPSVHRTIALTFSGMSLSLFGGGYVVIPAMQKIVVNTLQWLSNKEFTDAVAMGQITPGPIFISATFIGYKVAGFWGALNATLSIFLPAGLLIIVCARFLDRIKASSFLSAAFKGLRPAVIGMIYSAALTILLNSDSSAATAILFLIALIVAVRFKVNPVYLIPAAGLVGLLVFRNA